jgi:hypothetical protein
MAELSQTIRMASLITNQIALCFVLSDTIPIDKLAYSYFILYFESAITRVIQKVRGLPYKETR